MPLPVSARILVVRVFLLLSFYSCSGRTEENTDSTCRIDYIPLSLPPNCTTLTIRGRNLQTLEPASFAAICSSPLTELNISNNGISRIQSQALCFSSLLVLDLSLNNIQGIDNTSFSNVTDLVELDLHGNIIRSIADDAFTQQMKLKILRLDGNHLTQVSFFLQPMRSLERLNLTKNAIDFVAPTAFNQSSKMKYLLLAYNHLTVIPKAGVMRKLHVLNLQSNNISGNIMASQVHFEYLEELRLTNNFISHIDPDAFQYLDMLEELYLDRNLLTTFEAWTNSQQGIVKIQLDHNPWDCSCDNNEPWQQIQRREQDGELTIVERNETYCRTPISKKYDRVLDAVESCIPTLYYILMSVASAVALVVIITAVACFMKRRKSPSASSVQPTPPSLALHAPPQEGHKYKGAHPPAPLGPAPVPEHLYDYADIQAAIRRDPSLSYDYVNKRLVKQHLAKSQVISEDYLVPL